MTAIVGIKQVDDVWLGADSFCGNGDGKSLVVHPKVFRLFEPSQDRPILMATCGSARVYQLLRYTLEVPGFMEGRDPVHYLVSDFCASLKKCLDLGGILQKRDGEDYYDGSAILGFEKRLFVMTHGFTFEEDHRGYYGFAAGGEYACGSLYTTQGGAYSPEERLRIALEAAAELSQYVAPPFHIEKL